MWPGLQHGPEKNSKWNWVGSKCIGPKHVKQTGWEAADLISDSRIQSNSIS